MEAVEAGLEVVTDIACKAHVEPKLLRTAQFVVAQLAVARVCKECSPKTITGDFLQTEADRQLSARLTKAVNRVTYLVDRAKNEEEASDIDFRQANVLETAAATAASVGKKDLDVREKRLKELVALLCTKAGTDGEMKAIWSNGCETFEKLVEASGAVHKPENSDLKDTYKVASADCMGNSIWIGCMCWAMRDAFRVTHGSE